MCLFRWGCGQNHALGIYHLTDYRLRKGPWLEVIWNISGYHLEVIWKSAGCQLVVIWRSLGGPLEFIWSSCGGHLEVIWGSVGGHLEVISKSFGCHLQVRWSTQHPDDLQMTSRRYPDRPWPSPPPQEQTFRRSRLPPRPGTITTRVAWPPALAVGLNFFDNSDLAVHGEPKYSDNSGVLKCIQNPQNR